MRKSKAGGGIYLYRFQSPASNSLLPETAWQKNVTAWVPCFPQQCRLLVRDNEHFSSPGKPGLILV